MPLTHPNWIWGRQREPRAIWGFVSHFCSLTQRGAASPVLFFSPMGHFLPFPLQHGLFCWGCLSLGLGISSSRSTGKEES